MICLDIFESYQLIATVLHMNVSQHNFVQLPVQPTCWTSNTHQVAMGKKVD